jgi:adenine deaminase
MCATANAADHYKLSKLTGRIAAGLQADIAVVPDLETFMPTLVVSRGKIAAVNGKTVQNIFPKKLEYPSRAMKTVKCGAICKKDISVVPSSGPIRVIVAQEGSLYTAEQIAPNFSVSKDVLKLVALNRYQSGAKPRLAVGAIHGFGLKDGAICSTVAHDCHNIICVGSDDSSIVSAINAVIRAGGGMTVYNAKRGKTTALLKLPLAGLMSINGFAQVSSEIEALDLAASAIGCEMEHPFAVLSFMALEVIPKLKITTKGLVDVESFSYVPLEIGKEK